MESTLTVRIDGKQAERSAKELQRALEATEKAGKEADVDNVATERHQSSVGKEEGLHHKHRGHNEQCRMRPK